MTDTMTIEATAPGAGPTLYEVTLVAESIQVTADDAATAERYALSDAKEFRRDWNFHQEIVDSAASHIEAAEDAADIAVEVQQTDAHDETWTFEAHFRMTVAADSEAEAIAAARDLVKS